MKAVEKLAVATMMQKRLKEQLDQRNPDSLRAQCDVELVKMFDDAGVDRKQIKINGKKVGTHSLTFSKAKKETTAVIEDYPKFTSWLQSEEGKDLLTRAVNASPSTFTKLLEKTGEQADGVSLLALDVPEMVKGSMVRVDDAAMQEALGAQLPEAVMGFLGGVEDE